MTTIVHRTPGLLDTRAFTVMGMSAKPTTGHPIGQFGTGLKYSIAGLLRSGAKVSIWIGREHWQFELEDEKFRGSTFTRIVAWVRKWGGLRRKRIELPFTTQLGPHWTWWMWLRELHSNTLDEGGETYITSDPYSGPELDEDHTTIEVTHPDYAQAWQDRHEVFLPGATPLADAGRAVLQVLPETSQRLYYRGVRALDLRLPGIRTWNILCQTPLTEDRTMQEWYARHHLARWLLTECEDEALIMEVLEAEDTVWEHELELPHHVSPSQTFSIAAARCRRTSGRAGAYLSHWAPPAPADTRTFFERRGRRWKVAEEQVLDERGSVVLAQPEGVSQDDWREIAGALVAGARATGQPLLATGGREPIIELVWEHEDPEEGPKMGIGVGEDAELTDWSLVTHARLALPPQPELPVDENGDDIPFG